MRPGEQDDHLSGIQTQRDLLAQAHHGRGDKAKLAQGQLLERYLPPARAFLRSLLPGADAVEDALQEFALRFVRGDLKTFDGRRGRFRDFVKAILRNLVCDHYRRRGKQAGPWTEGVPEPVMETLAWEGAGEAFGASWRDGLVKRTWEKWASEEGGKAVHKDFRLVLYRHVDHGRLPSPEMAERLTAQLGRKVSAGWVRNRLHHAREAFADALVEEIAGALPGSTPHEVLVQEVTDLGLLEYCRSALKRRDETVDLS